MTQEKKDGLFSECYTVANLAIIFYRTTPRPRKNNGNDILVGSKTAVIPV